MGVNSIQKLNKGGLGVTHLDNYVWCVDVNSIQKLSYTKGFRRYSFGQISVARGCKLNPKKKQMGFRRYSFGSEIIGSMRYSNTGAVNKVL